VISTFAERAGIVSLAKPDCVWFVGNPEIILGPGLPGKTANS
jgi:hypothetical protein